MGASVALERAGYLLQRLLESGPSFAVKKARSALAAKREELLLKAGGQSHPPPARIPIRLLDSLREDALKEIIRSTSDPALLSAQLGSDLFLRGRWRCLSYGEVAIRPAKWHEDDIHGHRWNMGFFRRIDYVLPNVRCDVKVVWEKSRLQWLTAAAISNALASNDSRHGSKAEIIGDTISDWHSANPYCLGVNWTSGMEVAIRAVNLSIILIFSRDSLSSDHRNVLLQCLWGHRRYLRRYPEYSDVSGNHHLACLLGEVALEVTLRGHHASRRVIRNFVNACAEQFSPSGFHLENATIYHRLCTEIMSVADAFISRVCTRSSMILGQLIAKALRACSLLANSTGELPIFGDSDSGKIMDFGQNNRRFGHIEGGSRNSQCIGETTYGALLRGLAGPDSERPKKENAISINTSLGPFSVLKNGTSKVVVKSGPLGLAGRASHDHDDQMSFWYSVDGEDITTEAGTRPYTLDPAQRALALASSSHNVISALGSCRYKPKNGSIYTTVRGGPVAVARWASSPPNHVLITRLKKGASRLFAGCPTSHTRSFQLSDDLVIRDVFSFDYPVEFVSFFHFPPGSITSVLGGQSLSVRLRRHLAIYSWKSSTPINAAVKDYDFSQSYGEALPAKKLALSGQCTGTVSIFMRIAVTRADEPDS